MLKAITFDCWGTLVDVHHNLKVQRTRYLAQAVGCTGGEALAAFEESWTVYRDATAAGLGLPPSMLLNDTLGRLGRSLRPPDYQRVLRHWEEHLLDSTPDLLPGVVSVLQDLRRQGYLVGLISDTGVTPGRVLRRLLAQYDLLRHFDWLTFSDEMGVAKAHRMAFLATCSALGVAPEHSLHVGDSPRGRHRWRSPRRAARPRCYWRTRIARGDANAPTWC